MDYVQRPSSDQYAFFEDTLVIALDRAVYFSARPDYRLLPINTSKERSVFLRYTEIADMLLEETVQ
jgi:hypothetical protein